MCVLGFKCELVLCVQDKLHLFRTKPFNLIYCGKRWTRKDSTYGSDHSLRRRSLHIAASVRAAGTGNPAKQSRGQLVCLASTGQELLQFIRGGGSYLYFLDYDLGRDSPQRRGPCPADLPHGPRRENRLCYRPWGEGHGYSAQRRAGLWVY